MNILTEQIYDNNFALKLIAEDTKLILFEMSNDKNIFIDLLAGSLDTGNPTTFENVLISASIHCHISVKLLIFWLSDITCGGKSQLPE